MSLDELDLILNKEAIITTFPAQSLVSEPQRVESEYLVHAKTHVPLGETARYVDNLFKWVSGVNKGTFVGAVLGDYGEGKTSFLVHVWAESKERRVLAVPPFQWRTFEGIIDAIGAWFGYLLKDTRPDLARQVERLSSDFREQSAEALARETVEREGGDYDATLQTIRRLLDAGVVHLRAMSAARVLDFCARASEIAIAAGYLGLLVLLDEPEKAADALGTQAVHLFLFDLADELLRRQGNYGVFVSLPRNFHASALSKFPALTARLEGRNCFPSLSDLYGPGFATDLWQRYASAFALDELADQIVTPLALEAIGQVGSSGRKDLSYGPRTIVSAFRRMVGEWHRTRTPYTPEQFVDDALSQEILLPDGYRTKVQSVLRSPDVDDDNRDAVRLLAALPAGVRVETLEALGIIELLRPLAHANGPVYRTVMSMGLKALRQSDGGGSARDPLMDTIVDIDSEFAHDRRAFENALSSFCEDIIPEILRERQGHQLAGWQVLLQPKPAGTLLWVGTFCGAFAQAARMYPQRATVLLVGGIGAQVKGIAVPKLQEEAGPLDYDLQLSFLLRWNHEDEAFSQRACVACTERLTRIQIHFDLTEGVLAQDRLAELVGAERLTPFWALNLLHEMRKAQLGKEHEVVWQNLRADLVRKLVGAISECATALGDAAHEALGERPAGTGLDLLGSVSLLALKHRYPDYHTLIRQPQWQKRVDDYIKALTSAEVPLAAKRGREAWRPEDAVVTRVLGANRMNLSGGVYSDYESLISIESKGRNEPLVVRFHTHPLEEEIRATICSQPLGGGRKFRQEGKECWYLPFEELLPVVTRKGYTTEELRKVIEIGKARGSYAVGQKGRDQVLYCMPLDPEELKAQLRAKLADLVSEITEYNKLPDFVSTLDVDRVSEEIKSVIDDADYERLVQRLNREFESLHQRLPPYFDRVQQRLHAVRNQTAGLQGQLSGSREVSQIVVPVTRSPWRQALELYIVPNLQREGDELRTEAKALLARADAAIAKYVHSPSRPPAQNLAVLLEGTTTASGIEAPQTALVDKARQWFVHVTELNQWFNLLRAESDPLYERLLELESDESHRVKAAELLADFDGVSQRISDHLQLRNVVGLPSYPQFAHEIKDLDARRQEYLNTLKSSFDQVKARANKLLEKMKIDGRVSVIFNPAAVSGCYAQLYADGARLIRETGCGRALREAEDQGRDLRYARDILKAFTDEDASTLLAMLDAVREKMSALSDQANDVWLRQLCEAQSEIVVDALVASIDQAFSAIRTVRQKVSAVSRVDPPKDGDAATLYAAFPASGQADLKELVLAMMEKTDSPSSALETSLGALAELFRRNAVQITVSRRNR